MQSVGSGITGTAPVRLTSSAFFGEVLVDLGNFWSEDVRNPLEYIGSFGPATRVTEAKCALRLANSCSVICIAFSPIVFQYVAIRAKAFMPF